MAIGVNLKKDSYCPFLDKDYNYLEITLDPSVESSLAVISGSSKKYLCVKNDGTYNIYINIDTLSVRVIKIEN